MRTDEHVKNWTLEMVLECHGSMDRKHPKLCIYGDEREECVYRGKLCCNNELRLIREQDGGKEVRYIHNIVAYECRRG